MKFLNNWRINLANVPAYVEFNQDFVEEIDYALASFILESEDERLAPESKDEFRKLVAFINKPTNEVKVQYNPRCGIGRRYAETPKPTYTDGRPNPLFGKYYSALIAMPRVVKNTIFHYQGWRDYDQVKGHPTILFAIAKKNGKRLPAYEDYLKAGRFDEIVAELSAFYSADPENTLTKKDIKKLFNKTIYGGGFKEWIKKIQSGDNKDGDIPKEVKNADQQHPIYQAFYRDTQSVISLVYENNESLVAKVCPDLENNETNLWKRKNRTMSYFCGILENEITFQAYKYACDNGMCKKRRVSWGYDGFTIPPPPAYFDEEFHLNAMNEYVREKTGLTDIGFIRKGFEPEEILTDCLEARRAIPNAVPAVAQEVIIGEDIADAPPDGGDDQDERYMVWKENFERDWCKIKNTACFMRTCFTQDGKFEKFVLHTEKQIVSAYKHESYNLEQNGKTKKISFVNEWLSDPTMRCYDDAEVYPPPLVCPPNKFNLWRPFAFQDDEMNADSPDYDAEGVQMWCDHLKILCNHEQPVFEYVAAWVAHSVQQPALKPECMMTFVSDEGVGKNIFTSSLGAIYGAGKKLETPTPEKDCWGAHNTPMASSFLVVLSETDKRNTGGAEGKIKALITDPPLVINPKGKDQYNIVSYHRLITNSNAADPTKTSKGDRRNLIIRCSDEKKGDEEYFSVLAERLSRQNTLRSIYCCLKATDLSLWSFRKVPRTIYHETIIEGNRPALEIFLEHFTINNRDAAGGELNLYGTEMLQHFRKWKEDTGYAFDEKISEGILVKRLLTELKLPTDTITKLGRGKRGIKRRYDITKLKTRFNITEGYAGQPYTTQGGILMENEMLDNEDSSVEDEV